MADRSPRIIISGSGGYTQQRIYCPSFSLKISCDLRNQMLRPAESHRRRMCGLERSACQASDRRGSCLLSDLVATTAMAGDQMGHSQSKHWCTKPLPGISNYRQIEPNFTTARMYACGQPDFRFFTRFQAK